MTAPVTVKAIVFDTFGTVVDWRGSIARKAAELARRKGIAGVDWDAFARAWRAGYAPGMARVKSGERPWTALDTIHRERLDEILPEFGLGDAFDEGEKAAINRLWHALDPWPDSIPGLGRLRTRHLIAPLSNGPVMLLATMAKRAAIPWDIVFGSDMFETYKPDPAFYLGAVRLLDAEPGEVMMAASHNDDLAAARALGLRTAYVNRPYEYGADQAKDFEAESDWDVIADSIEDVADKMGC